VTTVRERIAAVLSGAVDYEVGLDALTVAPADEVGPALTAALHDACARLWRGGWQPAELHRVVLRRGRPAHGHLVSDAVAAYLRGFSTGTVDARWLAQAADVGATVWWSADAGYLDAFGGRHRLDRITVLDTVLALLAVLATLPAIEVLIPPPGAAPSGGGRGGPAGPGTVDARLLDRVRALLAKAESTAYPAEAEAYTAKAQELMTRHSLDEAMLPPRSGGTAVVPFARRIGVDHPYEAEKAALLDAVARANRCHAVWSPELGLVTVFGFDADIDAVDLIYTSLLVQGDRAMARTEPPGGKAGRAKLKAFRQSFLVAYTSRIGERLTEAAGVALADGTVADGSALLPVLASRDEQVRDTMHRVFPRTVRSRGGRVDSREGWDSGRAAADGAALPAG
jgi:hypothetical protein